jgi:hypothetical protein
MEGVPHRLIEGALIAAYAAGASQIYIYVNAEANLSAQRVEAAIKQARGAGLIGESVLGSGFSCEVSVRRAFAARRLPCSTPSKATAASLGYALLSLPTPDFSASPRSSTTWRRWSMCRASLIEVGRGSLKSVRTRPGAPSWSASAGRCSGLGWPRSPWALPCVG